MIDLLHLTRRAAGARRVEIATVSAFVICIAAKSFGPLSDPRFWAEEGSHYYAHIQHLSFWKALTYVGSGNYQFLSNVIVYFSSLFPARYAAYPTTYIPFGAAIYLAWLFGVFARQYGNRLTSAAITGVLLALLPASYEVMLSTTNVMWVCGAIALLICVLPEPPSRNASIVRITALALCGLSGIPANLLFPFFLLTLYLERTPYRLKLTLILGLTLAIEMFVVLTHPQLAARGFELTWHGIVPFFFQSAFSLFVPVEALDAAGSNIVIYGAHERWLGFYVLIAGATISLFICALAWSARNARTVLFLSTVSVTVAGINEFLALGGIDGFHSGWVGGRYFFTSSLCVVLLLCMGSGSSDAFRRRTAIGLMLLAVTNGGIQRISNSKWLSGFVDGPSISRQVDECRDVRPCTVTTWPFGEMRIYRP